MHYPEFFKSIPSMTLHDPLADILGACQDGLITYGYLDAVKLTGHSCPTVAGAYLMALKGLAILYPDSQPVRGEIAVKLKEKKEHTVTGVVANVLSFITGASDAGGFKGVDGRYSRNGLLTFGADIAASVSLRRTDTKMTVLLDYNPAVLGLPAVDASLMKRVIGGTASEREADAFTLQWQENVKTVFKKKETAGLVSARLQAD